MPSLNLASGNKLHPREHETKTGNLVATNDEIVLDLNGCSGVFVYLATTGNITLAFSGSFTGNNYLPTIAYTVNALANVPGIAIVNPGISSWYIPASGFAKVRVVATAITAVCVVTINGTNATFQREKKTPLSVTATAAVGVASVLTLPAVLGMRHKLQRLRIERSNGTTAALVAGSAPSIVTSTNVPGGWATNMAADALAQGGLTEKEVNFDNLVASAAGINTTFTYPATTGVISRLTCFYDLML